MSGPDQNEQPADDHRSEWMRQARQRLTRLEAEMHRLRAELGRVEADGEDARAAELESELEALGIERLEFERQAEPDAFPAETAAFRAEEKASQQFPVASTNSKRSRPKKASGKRQTRKGIQWKLSAAESHDHATPKFAVDPAQAIEAKAEAKARQSRRSKRKLPPWAASLSVHAVILLVLALAGFAVTPPPRPITLSTATEDDFFDEVTPLEMEPIDSEMLEELTESAEPLLADLSEVSLDALPSTDAIELASFETTELLPSDVGALMAEAAGGAPAAEGKPTAKPGKQTASFFGSKATGDRFVFLIDNSGSMQRGRMETTMMELLKTVRSLSYSQSFYVIFYSDQAYPMFYPESVEEMLPATRENRDRLERWLHTVEICLGGALKDAMAMAEKLEPDAVYVLSDGDYLFYERDGQRVMSSSLRKLTEPNDWKFTINTLGMTVRDADDAEALTLIAQAHGGKFRNVSVHPAAEQRSRQRPIRYNREPGKVWGTKVGSRWGSR